MGEPPGDTLSTAGQVTLRLTRTATTTDRLRHFISVTLEFSEGDLRRHTQKSIFSLMHMFSEFRGGGQTLCTPPPPRYGLAMLITSDALFCEQDN